jgi:hypothetical protein
MHRRRLSETGDASSVSATTTPRASALALSAYEAFIDQPSDATAHTRARHERPVRQLCDAQLTVALRG